MGSDSERLSSAALDRDASHSDSSRARSLVEQRRASRDGDLALEDDGRGDGLGGEQVELSTERRHDRDEAAKVEDTDLGWQVGQCSKDASALLLAESRQLTGQCP